MPYFYVDGLETERLITRYLTPADVEIWQKFLADAESTAYLPNIDNRPLAEWTQFWIDRQLTRYRENKYGLQALIHKETGEFVGQCGLLLQDVNGTPELEVGYQIFKQFRGKGYATEAARRFRDFGFEHAQAPSIVSIIHVNNVNSQRVAVRNGMRQGERLPLYGMEVFIYRISRAEWEHTS